MPPELSPRDLKVVAEALAKIEDKTTLSFKAFLATLNINPRDIKEKKKLIKDEVMRLLAEEEEEEEEEEDEEEEEEEEEDDSAEETQSSPPKKKGNAFTKPMQLSEKLAAFMGEETMGRTTVSKRLWAYVKEKDLQDPSDRRKIKLDQDLQNVFGVKTVTMFTINKYISKHLYPIYDDEPESLSESESGSESEPESDVDGNSNQAVVATTSSGAKTGKVKAKAKAKAKSKDKLKAKTKPTKKSQPGAKGDDAAKKKIRRRMPIFNLTAPLAEVVGSQTLSKGGCIKSVWKYIKANNLQDPNNGRSILADSKLKELFAGQSKIDMMKISSFISANCLDKVGMTDTSLDKDIIQ